MIELTPREIRGIGYNRYFNTKGRMGIGLGLIALSLAVAIVFTELTDKYISDVLQMVVGAIIVILGFIYYVNVMRHADKEGKKFLEQWRKEKQEVKP
jgi:hypothetical protein